MRVVLDDYADFRYGPGIGGEVRPHPREGNHRLIRNVPTRLYGLSVEVPAASWPATITRWEADWLVQWAEAESAWPSGATRKLARHPMVLTEVAHCNG